MFRFSLESSIYASRDTSNAREKVLGSPWGTSVMIVRIRYPQPESVELRWVYLEMPPSTLGALGGLRSPGGWSCPWC